MSNPFVAGDILVSLWGYDQTNVDFYQVVSVTAKMVAIRKIGTESVPGSGEKLFCQDQCVPKKDTFLGDCMRKKVCFYSNKPYVNIASYARAYGWDGEPQRRSWYA